MARNRFQKFHFFMATLLVSYIRDGEPKQRYMNSLLQLEKKDITYDVLNNTRIACLQRLHDESGVPTEDVKDFITVNFTHLGHMTEDEFHGRDPKVKRSH